MSKWKRSYKIKGKTTDQFGKPLKQYDYGYTKGNYFKRIRVITGKKNK